MRADLEHGHATAVGAARVANLEELLAALLEQIDSPRRTRPKLSPTEAAAS